MARRIWGISSAVIAALMALSALVAWTATASAAGPPAVKATDPNANSPAGVIYSIPLDNARQDAAPHGHHGGSGSSGIGGPGGGSGGGGSGGGVGGSGGSSSGTPSGGTGSSSASNSTGGAAGSGGTVLVPGGQPASLIHSRNGFGSSSAVPGLSAPASAGFRSVQSNASDAPVFAILLAAVVMLLGAFVGSRSWRARAH